MMLSWDQIIAIQPHLIISFAIVVVMLFVSFKRNHLLVNGLTLLAFLAALYSLVSVTQGSPQQVTPLIIIDGLSVFFMGLVLISCLVVTVFSYNYFQRGDDVKEEFYLLLLLAALGGLVLVSANHFASFFLGLELISVSLFSMLTYTIEESTHRDGAIEASAKYLVLSAVSSCFLLFGMALIYADSGVLSFSGLQVFFLTNTQIQSAYFVIGITLILVGVGFKLSLVPFHMWTPDVYEGSPVPVTAFVATVSKVALFAVLLRFFMDSAAYRYGSVINALAVVACLSMLVGNFLALQQNNVKRLLAYSSISHLGYLMVAFIAAALLFNKPEVSSSLSIEAIAIYLVAYVVTTLGAFGIVCIFSQPENSQEADDIHFYEGLFWRHPWLATIFTAMLLSLAGIPLTLGFIGKFYVFAAAIQADLWWLLVVLIIGSALGLYYYLRIILAMTKKPADNVEAAVALPLEGRLVLMVLFAVLLILGVLPASLIDLTENLLMGF